MADFKIGDRVRIRKSGALAVVTHAARREGRVQERVEVRREHDGSVYSFWFDEIEPAARASEAAPEEPAPEPKVSPPTAAKGKGKKAS